MNIVQIGEMLGVTTYLLGNGDHLTVREDRFRLDLNDGQTFSGTYEDFLICMNRYLDIAVTVW